SFTRAPPPASALFPYTPLFRSNPFDAARRSHRILVVAAVGNSFCGEGDEVCAVAWQHFAAVGDAEAFSGQRGDPADGLAQREDGDRKSTRLNSSHVKISYAVFC